MMVRVEVVRAEIQFYLRASLLDEKEREVLQLLQSKGGRGHGYVDTYGERFAFGELQ